MFWNKIKEKLVKAKKEDEEKDEMEYALPKEENIVEKKSYSQERSRKGGKYYPGKLVYDRTGLQGLRKCVRNKHQKLWRRYKQIIAPNSRLFYLWVPGSDKYTCVALVEADLKI